jgi:uncharacterized protein (TIGR02996 family)
VIVVPRAGKTVVAKVDRAALLAEVLAHPEDDGVRLIYADHLISTGDPRGELIAVQVKLATTPPRQRKQLVARETALLRAHRRTWTKEASQVAKRWEIRRGFVAKVEATCQAFASDGAALMAREPVEELVLSAPTTPGLLALAGAAHVARLRAIELDKFWVRTAKDAAVLNAFLRSPHVAQVPRLALRLGFARGRGVPDPGTLFDGVVLSNVRELAVSWLRSELGPQADNLVAGLAAVKAPALVRVRIGGTPAQRKVIAAAFPNAALDPAT